MRICLSNGVDHLMRQIHGTYGMSVYEEAVRARRRILFLVNTAARFAVPARCVETARPEI